MVVTEYMVVVAVLRYNCDTFWEGPSKPLKTTHNTVSRLRFVCQVCYLMIQELLWLHSSTSVIEEMISVEHWWNGYDGG